MGSYESLLQEHQALMEFQIELKKRQIEVLQKEIVELEKNRKDVKDYLGQTICKECKKVSPANKKLIMGSGETYCLDCGYQVLDLLKARNDKHDIESQSYKEFYQEVKDKNKQNAFL